MNTEWKSFLIQQGAVLAEDSVLDFGDPKGELRSVRGQTVLTDLSHLSLIRAQGEDALDFLNGQLTNDVRQLDNAHSQLNAYCTAQGRMLAVFRVFRRRDAYLLQLPTPLRESILKRLRMFVMRAKVTLELVDDELQRVGLVGPHALEVLRDLLGVAPEGADAAITIMPADLTVLSFPGIHPRYELVTPPRAAMTLWEQLASRTTKCGSFAWAWHDIHAGLPTVLPETSEAFVPQMVNFELIEGISFKKGCYPGQEIIARTHYLGRLKQRMYRAHVASAKAPRPGDPVFAPNFPGQAAGTVVDAQPSPDNGFDLLAVIRISSVDGGDLRLAAADGPRLTLQPLPYPFAETT